MKWETVIGLEIHAELLTESKLFCGCATAFGKSPNTQCCPVCTGMPGTLPSLNRRAVELAVLAGLGLGCTVAAQTRFDRKNYFYPDLPKAYQISQLYAPLCRDGYLDIAVPAAKRIRIREIHLEEDAGKLIHDRGEQSLCDYNRCGVPLIEIVTEPDFRSGAEAAAFVKELRHVLRILGVSDCKMQEGSMRVDVNLSVRPAGSPELGARTEMKNLNSIRSVVRAAEAEARRQTALLEKEEAVPQETRRWDEAQGQTFSMRTKEEAADYRYFPEPDLPPLALDPAWIRSVEDGLPTLPAAVRAQCRKLGLSEESAELLLGEPALLDFFRASLACGAPPREACSWILGEVRRILSERGMEPEKLSMKPEKFALLLDLLEQGAVNRQGAKETLEAIFDGTADPAAYIRENGLEQTSDAAVIREAAARAAAEHPKARDDWRAGREQALGFLMGQCMRLLQGRGDPTAVRRELLRLLNGEE